MKTLVLGSSCSIHFPGEGCSCDACQDPIFARRKNASLLIRDIQIDCGEDWKTIPSVVNKIVITHSHPDHAFGLKYHLDKQMYMSDISYHVLRRHRIIPEDKKVNILCCVPGVQIQQEL